MITTQPLLAGFASLDATFAWRRGRPVSCARFLADVHAVAAALPGRGHVLNVCADRYRFAVGLAAALLREQTSLLPPSTHVGTVRQLLARFPDAYCLAEAPQPEIDLPQTMVTEMMATGDVLAARDIPSIPVDRTVAHVFTSGSTGTPTLHRKRWGPLVVNVRAEAERLACDGGGSDGTPLAIVATVPAQHMYGFESSLWMAMQSGAAIVAERPFFPADITAALDRIPGRRLLVTTPFHLKALMAESTRLPAVELVLCATAPLSLALAEEAERRFGAPVAEIYGCTETGQLASRRPTVDPCWLPLGDVRLTVDAAGRAVASGGHVEQPTELADLIVPASDLTSRRFSLAGRAVDLVNIAGKRTSIGHLNTQLNAIEGVIDGVFVVPADDAASRDGVTRLVAVVVAPTLDTARLLAALRARIDAVFLPRPIHFVDRLPRNGSGKLTHALLQRLVSVASGDRSVGDACR